MSNDELLGNLLTAIIVVLFLAIIYVTFVRARAYWRVGLGGFGTRERGVKPVDPRYV
jgi:hypothetical protein